MIEMANLFKSPSLLLLLSSLLSASMHKFWVGGSIRRERQEKQIYSYPKFSLTICTILVCRQIPLVLHCILK